MSTEISATGVTDEINGENCPRRFKCMFPVTEKQETRGKETLMQFFNSKMGYYYGKVWQTLRQGEVR